MSTSTSTRTYRALYAGRPCRATTCSDGQTFAVVLDRDPGYGPMVFTRIYRSELELLEEVDREPVDQPAEEPPAAALLQPLAAAVRRGHLHPAPAVRAKLDELRARVAVELA